MAEKVMAIVGSRTMSNQMIADVQEATLKALNKGWKIATGGALGTDNVALKTALDAGKGSMVELYLPGTIADQPKSVQANINAAKAQGATIIENCGGDAPKFKETWYTNRNNAIIDNSDAVVAFQNNNSGGTQSGIDRALESETHVKVNKYLKGTKVGEYMKKFLKAAGKTMAIFAPIDIFTDAFFWADEYEALKDYEDFRNGTATDEQKERLKSYGLIEDNGDGTYQDNLLPQASADPDSASYYAGTGRVGNPYHDEIGQFCSEAEAVTICW